MLEYFCLSFPFQFTFPLEFVYVLLSLPLSDQKITFWSDFFFRRTICPLSPQVRSSSDSWRNYVEQGALGAAGSQWLFFVDHAQGFYHGRRAAAR